MRYKKNSTKPKKSPVITDTLIQSRNFGEIVSIASRAALLTNRDRYIYGYALLQNQEPIAALVNLWLLVVKGAVKLQADCSAIAAYVFADGNLLLSASLSDEAMQILLLAGKSLAPQSAGYYALRKRLCDTLWQQRQFEQLERILKSNKEDFSGILVENLSKLDFFQPNRKLASNIPAFVGHILTGGACLVARDVTYHSDIAAIIGALANEIKSVFYQLQANGQKLSWSRELFENFVDYEVNILTQVLQLAVKNDSLSFDIIPTPSYLIHYDAASKRVSEKFLTWLQTENPELLAAYNIDTYQAVLWLLGDERISYSKILKSVQMLDPYLRLAIMLRSVTMKTVEPEPLVKLSDFTNTASTVIAFKELAIQIVKIRIGHQAYPDLPADFWQFLFDFSSVLQDPDCNNMLIINLIRKFKDLATTTALDLHVGVLRDTAQHLNMPDFIKPAEILCARQQVCDEFLLSLQDDKQTKKISKNITNLAALYEHLTLIADCCFLAHAQLVEPFFQHLKSLVQSKKINKLLPLLQDFCQHEFSCACESCRRTIYHLAIPDLVNELSLPVANFPEVHWPDQPKAATLKPSILLQTDPFKTLGVTASDSKPVIMQKIMQLIQQSPSQMAFYRQAQSELFHPGTRFLHQYLRYVSYDTETNIKPILPSASDFLTKIPLRHELLNES